MIAAVHALLGAALARLCRTRVQAALVGTASHPLADILPHRDLEIPQEALLLAATLTMIAAARGPGSPEFAGALGACLPDVENLVGRLAGVPDENLLLPTHRGQHGRETTGFHGQIAIAALGVLVLLAPRPDSRETGERGRSSR
jgi:hypothetical protein